MLSAEPKIPVMPTWRLERPIEVDGNLILQGEVMVSRSEKLLQAALAVGVGVENGSVLELGYGLGMSFSHLRGRGLAAHTVIEGNVWLAGEAMKAATSGESYSGFSAVIPSVIFDTWEHAVPSLPSSSFTGILFDPYPLDDEARELSSWQDQFSYVSRKAATDAARLLSDDGVLGFINFYPALCGQSWVEDQFLGMLDLVQVVDAPVDLPQPLASTRPEVWLLSPQRTTE